MSRTCLVFLVGLATAIHRILPEKQGKTAAKPQGTGLTHEVKASASASGLTQAKAVTKSEAKTEAQKESKKEVTHGSKIIWDPRKLTTLQTIALFIAATLLTTCAFLILSWFGRRKYDERSGLLKGFLQESGLSTSSSDVTSSETGSTDKELKNRMLRFEKRLQFHAAMLKEDINHNDGGGSMCSSTCSSTEYMKQWSAKNQSWYSGKQ